MRPSCMLWVLLAACQGGADKSPADGDVQDTTPDPVDTDTTPDTPPTPDDTGRLGEKVPPLVPDVIVDCNGGADFLTITEAIAASVSGTLIGLNPCVYNEDVDFIGKTLNIFGIEGSAVTTIDGSGYGPAVKAIHGESLGTRLAGVTVRGGTNPGYAGSGLVVDLAVLALEDVVFTQNNDAQAVVFGNGAFLESLDVVYEDNDLEPGAGIQILLNGSSIAQRETITCDGPDFAIYQHNAMILLDSEIDCGELHAIFNQGNGTHVRRSRVESKGTALIAADIDDTRNERVWLYNSVFVGQTGVSTAYMKVRAENNVFWGEDVGFDLQYADLESYLYSNAFTGDDCPIRTTSWETYDLGWNAVTSAGSDCHDGGHDSLVVDDFGFANAPLDFSLTAGSPLIDAGNPDSDQDDPDGTRNDIGIFGGPEGAGQL